LRRSWLAAPILAALVAAVAARVYSDRGAGSRVELPPELRATTNAWAAPNGDVRSTRDGAAAHAGGRTARAALPVRWRFRLPGEPGFSGIETATPVVSGGRVYIQDMNSNVYALDQRDGRPVWRHRYGRPDGGPNGVAVGYGRVFGGTDTSMFALAARDGREVWRARLTSSKNPITIAPLVANGLVYTGTTGQAPGGRGTLYALDERTGAVRWRFDTIARPWRFPREASGGGAWYPPSLDDHGSLYWGIANPYPWGGSKQHPNGGAYPGPVRYTDSLVVLDARSGKLRWFDQVTPHDVRDYDFQLSPIVVGDTVIGAGKAARVIAWQLDSHRRLWETRVGKQANDDGPLPTRPVRVCPGLLGGVETPMAYADGRVFVPVVDLCFRESAYGTKAVSFYGTDYSRGTGELVALDARTGRRLWTRRFRSPVFGCATVAGGVVFTSTYEGRVYGLSARGGSTVLRARARAGINACPAVAGDSVFVAAGTDHPAFPSPRFELIAYRLPRSLR